MGLVKAVAVIWTATMFRVPVRRYTRVQMNYVTVLIMTAIQLLMDCLQIRIVREILTETTVLTGAVKNAGIIPTVMSERCVIWTVKRVLMIPVILLLVIHLMAMRILA